MREAVYAVIHLVPGQSTPGMLPIAGRPLVGRQIEWLYAIGCAGVVVELDGDDASCAVARWIGEAYGDDVAVVTTGGVGAREAARRVGIGKAPLFAVPADLLGNGDLGYMASIANPFGVIAIFDRPAALGRKLGCATIRLVRAPLASSAARDHLPCRGQPSAVRGPGWAARVQSRDDAVALTVAAMLGELHGIDVEPETKRVA